VAAWQALRNRVDGLLGRAVLAVLLWVLAAALWSLVVLR
jgi:hypothetical protein